MDYHRIKKVLHQHTPASLEWKGAVLFLCNEEHVFLIKRSEHMPTHAGQIAFVGGHKQPHELSPWDVAQREFEEETSVMRNYLVYLGHLPVVHTSHRQEIVPVVAKLLLSSNSFLKQVKSNGEWDQMLAYPWSELIKEDKWNFAWRHGTDQSAVMFHSIKSGSYLSHQENQRPHLLWGATALMIWNFLRLYFDKYSDP
jgi:8-oxo-dGTP pyrophosphatase MutT (NUDIX family)